MRNIKEGNIVIVLVNEASELWALTHHPVHLEFRARQFKVTYTPSDTGDMWYLEGEDGIELAVNPSSANFDGLVKGRDTVLALDINVKKCCS